MYIYIYIYVYIYICIYIHGKTVYKNKNYFKNRIMFIISLKIFSYVFYPIVPVLALTT